MDEIILTNKMDELGRLMHELEQRQLEFDFENRELEHKIAELKDQLKPVFMEKKESMKSECLEIRYRKGAVKWSTHWLDGYSVDHPEILHFRKEGTPTIAFVLREDYDDGR